jgi:threonine/homoserine/homoserine lactone efflux protein
VPCGRGGEPLEGVTPGNFQAVDLNKGEAHITAGILTAAGVAIGQGVWTVAASLGRTSLPRASAPAFLALKAAGAVYLVCLGVRLAAEQR